MKPKKLVVCVWYNSKWETHSYFSADDKGMKRAFKLANELICLYGSSNVKVEMRF